MTYLLKLLHLRRNEAPRLGLAAALFFLVQIDDGIVKSVASAVFNVRAGVENLPLMYTWFAGLFSLSMILLSWLTAKVTRQRLLRGGGCHGVTEDGTSSLVMGAFPDEVTVSAL